MSKKMKQLSVIMVIATVMACSLGFAQPSIVAVTGETTTYAPGDDGFYQAGVTGPSPRFRDLGNGTVRDGLTGLIWLKQANCFGPVPWADAIADANNLASPNCGLADRSVAGDWRLPNVKELLSLIDYGFFQPALSNAAGTGQWTEGDAFSNVGARNCYWSSTTGVDLPSRAWFVGLDAGSATDIEDLANKANSCFVWPMWGGL